MPRTKKKSDRQKNKTEKLRQREKRTVETEKEQEYRLEKARQNAEGSRKSQTIEEKHHRLCAQSKRQNNLRKSETNEETQHRLCSDKKRHRELRESEPPEKKQLRLCAQNKRQIDLRKSEPPEKKQLRLRAQNKRQIDLRESEPPEKKQRRLHAQNKLQNDLRESEPPEKKQLRLRAQNKRQIDLRESEPPEKKQRRLRAQKKRQIDLRESEPPEKKQRRLHAQNKRQNDLRDCETQERTKARLCLQSKRQQELREQENQQETQHRLTKASDFIRKRRNECRNIVPENECVISAFLEKVCDSANYVCCCCHRLMYRTSVVHLKEQKYDKMPESLLQDVLAFRQTSYNDYEWICTTCHVTLKRGKMPAQSKANNMSLVPPPKELRDLNALELRLVCQRIAFMKMVGLPRGKQHGIHGPAVNVPSKLDAVCDVLPRLPSQSQVVGMKLKRSLKHSSHYMYESVRPDVVMNALRWLIKENPHYADIKINENWLEESRNDCELWTAVSRTQENNCSAQENITERPTENVQNVAQRNRSVNKDNRTGVSSVTGVGDCHNDYEKLTVMARQSRMNIIDVPGDGNCMFYAVWHHLERLGITDTNVVILRNKVADYMIENKEHYIDFVAARVETADLANADTEQPTAEDLIIDQITDLDTQREIRWIRYIDGLRIQSWGDHLVLQALADMYSVKVNVHSTSALMVHTISPRVENGETKEFDLGLMGQSHYVIFMPYTDADASVNQQCVRLHDRETSEHVETTLDSSHGNLSCSDDDEDFAQQDEYAFEEASKVRGLPYETSMMNEDPELLNKIISVAPADGEKPMPLLSDPNFEELSNPDKYPDGTNALTAERPVHLNPRKYFNQRLLDADGRFSRSIEYIFSAQYATECNQITSDINHYIFRRASGKHFQGKRLTAGMVKNVEQMKRFVKSDHAYRMLKNIRGTPAYFQTVFYDVLAMVRQLGIPTWFFTVSAADMQWPDVIQTIARQYGTLLTDDDVKELSFAERSQWLRRNPVTAARQFQYRLELLFRDVLKSKAQPLGEIVDYVIRIEFQARGSPHAHTLLWVKDAPQIDSDPDEAVASFIDKYISCAIPGDEDETLQTLVKKLQTHCHSSYCKKKGPCRFGFPRPPSPVTVIAKEPDDELANFKKDRASQVLQKVKDVISDDDSSKDAKLEDILDKANVSLQEYLQQLLVSQRGQTIVMKRSPAELLINPYNPVILKAWQANIDIQYIIDAYACVMYIAAYMTKNEKGIGELLKQVCKEYKDQEIKCMLRRVGSVFLNHREVSAQEAVYRILSIPMKKFSREVLFVNTDSKDVRAAVLKPQRELDDLGDEAENIFQSNIVERYSLRPNCIESMCLADFASNYKVRYAHTNEYTDDSVPVVLDITNEQEECPVELPDRIKLKKAGGTMYKRRRPAVIRFHKFSIEKDPSDFYRSKLMLYLPWRDEDVDLLSGYPDFASHYFAAHDLISVNENKYTENMELVQQAVENNAEYGPPEHAWANIAPGAEHQNLQDEGEGVEIERDINQEDLDANAELIENPKSVHASEIIARYETEAEKRILPDHEYRKMVRSLNRKQAQIVFFNRKWCKDAIIALRQKKPVRPYHVFMSGPGGVGKSHVIKLIHSDVRKFFRMSQTISASDMTVLLTAPTGVAAFNIGGMTIHSALVLQTKRYGDGHISFDKLNTLRSKLENLQLLIIDEISMVGSDMLLDIHKRLTKIKGISGASIFGNVSILAVGDLYQLPPVLQSRIYQSVRDPVERLQGNLWKDNFNLHELDEVMRQKGDSAFAEMLCRIRVGNHTEADISLLASRQIADGDPNYPHDALHVFAYNCDVDERNLKKLKELEPNEDKLTYIHASDDKTDSTGQVNLQKMNTSQKRSETAGLHTVLVLTVGARVMLTYNVDTADGLVNGVIGTVQNIVTTGNGKVDVILVKFDDETVGRNAISTSHWKNEYPNGVPIKRHEGKYEKGNKKGAQIARRQFPLTLAWAVTIHKCQGLTVDQIVVNMRKAKRFGKGQAYVAFSRVKTLEGLYIVDFDSAGIKADRKIEDEMEKMRQHSIVTEGLKLLEYQSPEWTILGHLNVRYFLNKMQDLLHERQAPIFHRTDVMCFNETYLTYEHNLANFAEKYQYEIFSRCVPSEKNHNGQHGVMICVKQRLQPRELIIDYHTLECKTVQFTVGQFKMVVVAVYRKPSYPIEQFCERFRAVIISLPLALPVFILGDFNDDLTEKQESNISKLMEEFGFEQYINQPTTDRGTLIDHIYHNNVGTRELITDVHDIYFSDHDMIFCGVKT